MNPIESFYWKIRCSYAPHAPSFRTSRVWPFLVHKQGQGKVDVNILRTGYTTISHLLRTCSTKIDQSGTVQVVPRNMTRLLRNTSTSYIFYLISKSHCNAPATRTETNPAFTCTVVIGCSTFFHCFVHISSSKHDRTTSNLLKNHTPTFQSAPARCAPVKRINSEHSGKHQRSSSVSFLTSGR